MPTRKELDKLRAEAAKKLPRRPKVRLPTRETVAQRKAAVTRQR